MKKTILYILFVCINAQAQSNIQLPKNYKQISIPKENSKEHLKLNYSKDQSIRLRNNEIEIFPTPRIMNSELKFNNGSLIGSNHGEWGGKLIYKTNEKEITIKEGNIISIFKLNGKIYFLEGLAHLSTNYGEVYELNYAEEKFSFRKIMNLPDEPQVFQIFNNKIYMATFSNFIIINNWKIESEINGFWESLYPNSLIIENKNHIFMGIRGGIVEIIPNTKILKLYIKK
ncbi:hypothetical protein [Flavobacterium sp. UBA4854]|uniref:hypothetical protein n=1 Tax=Flavobacterium sp. UBA4854 TaxID=1946548 RepID=UPI00257C2C8D|nr:hypothetical protein [Flavobacterium sp. UBA4854]